MTKIYVTLYCFLFTAFGAFSQKKFIETENNINSFSVSQDEKNIAFISDNKLFWSDVEQMKVLDSFPLRNQKDFYISNIRIIENKNVLLLKQKERNRFASYDFLEYPQDSIHIFNLNQKKITTSIAGNSYVDFFENQTNSMVYAYNNYYPYKDNTGTTNYSPLKGEIAAYPSNLKVKSPGVIRFLLKHPTKKEFVILYFYKDENKNKQYVIEVRSSETLEVLRNNKISFKNIISVSCSKDGSIWNLIEEESFSKNKSHLFEYSKLEEISNLEPNIAFSGWLVENKIVTLEDYSIKIYNAKTLEIEQEIWANLTKFSSLNGFHALSSDVLLIIGGKTGAMGKNGIQKFSLSQEEIYTKKQNVDKKSTLFDPKVALLVTNTLKDAYQDVLFYEDWMLLNFARSVEFWNLSKQKKWRTFSFSSAAYTHFNEKEMKLLVFEQATGKNFDDFVMRIINLKTGETTSKLFIDNPYPFINPLSASYNFIPTNTPDEWIGSDSQSIWLVDTKKMEFKSLHTFENNLSPNKIIAIKNDQLLFSISQRIESDKAFNTYINKGYFWYHLDTNLYDKIPTSEEWNNVHLLPNKALAYTTEKGFYILKDAQKKKIKDLKTTTKGSFITNKGLWVEKDQGFELIDLKGIEKKVAIHDVIKYNGFGANSKDAFAITSDSLFTYNPTSDFLNVWNILKTEKLLYPASEIAIHPTGQLLWKNKLFINLQTLSATQKFEEHGDSYLFDTLPYVVLKEFNKETQSFHWVIKTFDEIPKQIWMSSPIKSTEIYNQVNNFMFSETENQMIGYKNGSLYSNVNYFYWLDWKKDHNKTIETNKNILNLLKTNNPEIIKVVFTDNESTFFNIAAGNWERNFKPTVAEKEYPTLNYQQVAWKDKNGEDKNFYSREYLKTSFYSEKLQKLIAGSESGKVFVWDLENSTPREIIITGTTEPIVRIIEDKKQLIAVDSYGSLHFIDTKTFKWKLTIYVQEYKADKYSILWYTPEGFYSAEKAALRDFHFIKEEKVLPLTIFDAYLNRPDKILEKLENTDPTLLNLYKEATQKRMKKLGVSQEIDFWNIERPQVTFADNFNPDQTTEEPTLNIPLRFSENTKVIEIYDNGVLINKKTPSTKKDFIAKIELHSGENNISITTKDKNQIESEPLSFKIFNKKIVKAKTYYIGIGVSTYKDSTMNLKYAVKDIEKLEEYFKSWRFEKDTVEIHTIINEQVTIKNIQKIKEILNKTNVNDKVIISFSGHGLINNDKEFYFAGYNTDFTSPEKGGIPYDLIQSLTDNIPARKRLILIDACHSGSLDTEEDLLVRNDPNVKEHNIKGSIIVKGSKTQSLDSFEQMQNMFFDLNKSNGTIIIAASGGKEYAYEGQDWNNGVFTYSLLKTLQEKGYDTWKGALGIPVSVLQKEVYKKVRNLTKGKQKPTARSENPDWDWEF